MLCINEIEDQIRNKCLIKRIRPDQYFIDFDSLRSGNVTESQFFRVLWENLDLKLTAQEETILANKYRIGITREIPKGAPDISYRNFCNSIANPVELENRCPTLVKSKEYFGTSRSVKPLDREHEDKIDRILDLLNKVYKFHGIDLRTACKTFDWSNRGVIEKSQFYRSLPKASGITDDDMFLLTSKYECNGGLFNYVNLHNDIECFRTDKTTHRKHIHKPLGLIPQVQKEISLQEVFDKIRIAVFKYGVRTFEYFKDYDKLRKGEVTITQFESAIHLAIGKEANLTPAEVSMVINYYTTPSRKVRYQEFCSMCEHAFNIPELEKQPTVDMVRPVRGELGRNVANIGEYEHECDQVIDRLRAEVRQKRVLVYPYFKDFDRSRAYSRVITALQFRRVLHFLNLNLGDEDFKVVCAKFRDQRTGDINYPAFVQTIDQDFTNYGKDEPAIPDIDFKVEDCVIKEANVVDETLSINSIIARIRHHALTKRLRVHEFFCDFDKLRCGEITCSQFRRCLSDLGLSKLGEHDLNDPQFAVLCEFYAPQGGVATDNVEWMRFADDIEIVFTRPGLEKLPTHKVDPSVIYECSKPGSMKWQNSGEEHRQLYDATMTKWKSRVQERRVLVKPLLQDFDLNNNGHITVQNFKQCMRMLELSTEPNALTSVVAKFKDDLGFDYFRFLGELEAPTAKEEELNKFGYEERLKTLRLQNNLPKMAEFHPETDLTRVLTNIKLKVMKERMRILEWMKDYDKMNCGRISKINFRRALDLCKMSLCESEIAMLEDHYRGNKNDVMYRNFNEDIESVFTEYDLEKKPCTEVTQFTESQQLTQEMNDLATRESDDGMANLAERVRASRMQLFPLFEDFDKINNGTVTMLQFRRVLQSLQIADIIKSELQWNCLYERFRQRVGGKVVMNYLKFCDEIYNIGKFEWRKP